MVCQRFKETGCCKSFNELGRCSLHHPLNIHSIIAVTARCPICSLPRPCQKCEYYKRRTHLEKYVGEKREALGSYKGTKMMEVLALAGKKTAAANAAHQKDSVKEKIKERTQTCKAGIDKLETQLEQIAGWLRNNVDCVDSGLYRSKTTWITNNVESAFYAVDRVLEEWRSRKERENK